MGRVKRQIPKDSDLLLTLISNINSFRADVKIYSHGQLSYKK